MIGVFGGFTFGEVPKSEVRNATPIIFGGVHVFTEEEGSARIISRHPDGIERDVSVDGQN